MKALNALVMHCQDEPPYKNCEEVYLSDFGESKVMVFKHDETMGKQALFAGSV